MPSSATRRSTSTPATTFRHPSSQPPFGTESMCPPTRTARSDSPGSVNHWLPAASIDSSAPVLATRPRSHSRARSHVSVQATRCAPSSSPVSSRSSFSSATVRFGSSRHATTLTGSFECGMLCRCVPESARRRLASRCSASCSSGLWALWEGYRKLWEETGWTRPFPVNATTMPHLHDIVGAVVRADPRRGAAARAVHARRGALHCQGGRGRVRDRSHDRVPLGALIAHFGVLQRGVMPYVVASQTIPILALAPIVVVGLGNVSSSAGSRRRTGCASP